ncbi:sulfotransferase family 2 domain-containing protein [Aliiroseovarius sp. S253]|uniref:sulfotransferase family 2 domain-containing protein n=1 Tax=Aliiroseovarius sp. S253 TaxID=3415133 RepID=UPI003C7B2B19
MPFVSRRLGVAFYFVPKVACTSLKTWFWEFENEEQAEPQERLTRRFLGKKKPAEDVARRSVHHRPETRTRSFKSSVPPPEGYQSLAVVRDPVDRLISAWKNKVNYDTFKRRDEIGDLENELLSTRPSFGEFLENYDAYRFNSRAVRVHTFPLEWHLGPDRSHFTQVFKLEELGTLAEHLSGLADKDVNFSNKNASGWVGREISLTADQKDILRVITKVDYQWLGNMYNQDESMARLL